MSEYEYRLDPDDVCVVQVRRVNHRRMGIRGTGWKTYYEGHSPSDARRILAMLDPEREQVTR